ncbi:hypothetical protein F5887DRAFT_1069473 [Amanita rubescens]|nr:hypothetical protein F5887DRAFT_1069473 [Amanita rubescens]
MHPVALSSETIVDIAKDMLTALECEWKMSNGKICGAVLGSWHLLEKHLLNHLKVKTHLGSNWLCKLPRCNSPVHGSLQQLQEHVQLSHMSRIALPCPFTFCTFPSIRFNQLSSHFDEEHSELDGKAIHDSELVLPMWMPFLPSSDGVPRLPKHVFPGTCLTMPVRLHPAPKHMELDMFSSQTVEKKHRPQLARNWTEPEGSPPNVTLDSLTHWQASRDEEDDQQWFNTLHPSWSALSDVSRPQGMHGTIYRQVVSPTIHFAVFARRVDEMEKAGHCQW